MIARIPIEKMPTSAILRFMGMLCRFSKKGMGMIQMIRSVARLNPAWRNQRITVLKHLEGRGWGVKPDRKSLTDHASEGGMQLATLKTIMPDVEKRRAAMVKRTKRRKTTWADPR